MAKAKDLLSFVKARTGLTSKALAKKLGYNASYFSRGVSGSASGEIEKKIRALFPAEAQEFDRIAAVASQNAAAVGAVKPGPVDKLEQAVLKALVQDHLRLKAEVTGRPIDELVDEFDQNTRLIFRGL